MIPIRLLKFIINQVTTWNQLLPFLVSVCSCLPLELKRWSEVSFSPTQFFSSLITFLNTFILIFHSFYPSFDKINYHLRQIVSRHHHLLSVFCILTLLVTVHHFKSSSKEQKRNETWLWDLRKSYQRCQLKNRIGDDGLTHRESIY